MNRISGLVGGIFRWGVLAWPVAHLVRRRPRVAWTVARGWRKARTCDAGGDDLLQGALVADCGEAFPARRPPTSAFGGPSPTRGEGAGGESVTNEANFDDNVNSSNVSTEIGITTNSGVDSGLDEGGN